MLFVSLSPRDYVVSCILRALKIDKALLYDSLERVSILIQILYHVAIKTTIRPIMNMVLWLPLVLHDGGTKQREKSAGHWLQCIPAELRCCSS